jgi:methyl-accepting chemotaxis protein
MSLKFITRSLNKKLITLFLAVSMIPLVAVSVISYSDSKAALEKQAFDQLHTLANDRGAALYKIDNLRKQQMAQITSLTAITDVVTGKTKNFDQIEALFLNIQQNTGGQNGYQNFKLVSPEGIVIYAQDKSLIGKDLSDDKFFQMGKTATYGELISDNGKRVKRVSAPLVDSITQEKIGVIIAEVVPTVIDTTLLERNGLGETGETYLVNYDRIMITPSRFNDGYEFKQKADTLPVKECFENGKSIDASVYPDYRGVPIYGASKCEKDLGYVLIAEYDVAEITKPVVALQNLYILIGGTSAGIVGAFAYFMSRSISRPIKSAAEVAEKIAQGDLTVTVLEPKTQDEVGALIKSEKKMVDSLRTVLTKVQQASGSVSAASQQLSASGQELNSAVQQIATTVDQISKGSQSQAQKTEQSKQSSERLAKSMETLSANAKKSVEAADSVKTLSEKGAESARQAGQKMDKIIEVTSNSADKVKNLASKTDEIVSVLDVIRQIADQTNLLALNAAIEAARAGESGRGFAVVADEVRRLAESSAKSAEEIAVKLTEMQEQAQKVVQEIEISSGEVTQGKTVIESALSSMSDIVSNIKEVSHNIKSLADTAQEQITEVGSVTSDVTEIAAISEENAASTEEAAAAVEEQTAQTDEISKAADHLADLSTQLQTEIAKFKLDGLKTDDANAKAESEANPIAIKIKKRS